MQKTNHILEMQPAETISLAHDKIWECLKNKCQRLLVDSANHAEQVKDMKDLLDKLEEFQQAYESLTAKDVVKNFSPAKDAA